MKQYLKACATLAVAAMMAGTPVIEARAQERSITNLSGDLYLYRNAAHNSVFLVTDEGVIATDPINADSAQWLEAAIRERFGKEIRYVVYSHSDEDHVAGGEEWADTATVVAHAKASRIVAEGDYTADPDILFQDQMSLHLGGQSVLLHYLGASHTDNLIVMEFPAERTVFIVDTISNHRLPYRTMNRWFMPEGIEFIRQVEQMDFDVFVPGHGDPGGPQDVVRHREYIEALYEAVLEARAAGLGVEEAQQSIKLEEFSDLGRYDQWLAENIEGMYRLTE